MSMNQPHRAIGHRNAPLVAMLLALPFMLLTRCTSSSDDVVGDPSPMPEPPVVACTTLEQCELPRSTCSGSSLVYYTDARCELGVCAWDQMTMGCASACDNGGCSMGTMTAGGSPPFQPSCGGAQSNATECVAGSGGSGGSAGDDDGGGGTCDADEDGGLDQCVP